MTLPAALLRVALLVGCSIALPLLTLASASAQDSQPTPKEGAGPGGLNLKAEFTDISGTKEGKPVITCVGPVQFDHGAVRVRCNNLIIFAETTKSTPEAPEGGGKFRPLEIYAEGLVLYQKGDEHVLCDRLFLDLEHDRGIFVEASLATKMSGRDGDVKLLFRAGEMRQLAHNRYEALDVMMSTCSFGRPHYHVRTDSIRAQIDPPATRPSSRDGDEVRNVRLDVDTTVLYAGGIPVFALPPIGGDSASPLGQEFSYIKSVDIDNSKRFGPTIRIGLGDDIYVDDKRWGEWRVTPQYLGDRGPGLGFDLDYRVRGEYGGEFKGIYQNDEGEDRFFGEPPSNDRGRVLYRHRHFLPEHIQTDFELSYISDEGFLPEYYEGEFKSGKEQESLFYLKRAVENRALTLLARGRLNDFQDQTEYLPQLGYNLIYEPVVDIGDFTTLYFDADYEAAYVRRRYPHRLDIADDETIRVDLDNKITTPFFAGPLKIAPFAGLRYTSYGDGRVIDRPIHRVGELYGVSLTTELSRTFADVAGGPLDLFGLRHIIHPEIVYENVQHVSRDVADFEQFDSVDAFTEDERVRFGVRNRLQTIWEIDGEPEVVDVVDLDLEWTYFPSAERDNFGDHVGNLDVDFLFRPSRELTIVNDFEYSFLLDTFEVFNVAAAYAPSLDFQVAAGYRRYVDVNDAVFIQTNWRMSERWEFGAFSSYDFVEGSFQDQRLIVRRIGHDWVVSFEISYDQGLDDLGFGVSFQPRFLFDPRLRARGLRTQPEFSEFSDNVIH